MAHVLLRLGFVLLSVCLTIAGATNDIPIMKAPMDESGRGEMHHLLVKSLDQTVVVDNRQKKNTQSNRKHTGLNHSTDNTMSRRARRATDNSDYEAVHRQTADTTETSEDFLVRCGYVTCDLRTEWCDTVTNDCATCSATCGSLNIHPSYVSLCNSKCHVYMAIKDQEKKTTVTKMKLRMAQVVLETKPDDVTVGTTSHPKQTDVVSTMIFAGMLATLISGVAIGLSVAVICIVIRYGRNANHHVIKDEQTETTDSLEDINCKERGSGQKRKVVVKTSNRDSGIEVTLSHEKCA